MEKENTILGISRSDLVSIGLAASLAGLGIFLANEYNKQVRVNCLNENIINEDGTRGLNYHPSQHYECEQFIPDSTIRERVREIYPDIRW